MGINKINSKSNWGEAAANLNNNFDTLNADILKIKDATTRNKGYFATAEDLFAALPSGQIGDVAFVGAEYPFKVYRRDTYGWANTGEYGGESVDLHEYYTKDEVDEKTEVLHVEISEEIDGVVTDIYNSLATQEQRINETTDKKITGLVVQETGDGENVVMSQKAVSEKIGEVLSQVVFDISEYNKVDDIPATYADLSEALGGIPQSVQKGGISIRFIQSSDNKYVQYRLMATYFSTAESDWQGVDDEPTPESDNLIKSGGVSAVNLRNKLFTEGFENQASASQGTSYNNTIDVNIEQNTEFVLNISGANNIISDNLINCRLKRSDDTIETLQYAFPVSVELTKNYDIKSITINRSSTGVVGDGIITLSVKAKNPFVKKDELNSYTPKSYADEINEHVNNLDVQINGVSEVNLLQGLTKLSGYYYSSSNNHIISTANNSSEYYGAIDISQYIGETLILTNNANKASSRTIAVTDSSNKVISSCAYQETDFKNAGGEISVNLDIDDIKYLYVSFSTGAVVTATVLSKGDGDFYTKEQVDEKIQEIDNHLVYVSTSGNDSNDGTSASPVATIQKALTLSSNVKVLNGTYNQDTIDLSLQTYRKINIFSEKDSRVILFGGTKVLESDGSIDSTFNNVKCAAVQNFSDSYHWIYQYGVVDTSTAININELTPYHKRRTYRCEHTTLTNVDSIQAISESAIPAFYYNNGILYYSSDIVISSSNFLFVPNGNLFSNTEDIEIHLVGIDVVGKNVNLQGTINSSISDCAAGYSMGDGAFILNNSKNVTLLRCEALRNEKGKEYTTGDGINVHSSSVAQSNILNVFTTFSIIDCWSHDNYNDGYSDHEGCQGIIRGGLYEYNCIGGHGAGLTPALGACDMIFDVICQSNKYDGIQYHGAGINQSATKNGYLYVNSSVCRNNLNDGFSFTQSVEVGDFVNCLAYNNGHYGFQNYSSNNMRLSNCKASGNITKDISDGCVIMI